MLFMYQQKKQCLSTFRRFAGIQTEVGRSFAYCLHISSEFLKTTKKALIYVS